MLVGTVAGAPQSTSPLDAVALAIEAAAARLQERRDYARKRNAVIVANAELRERELIKLASLAGAIAGELRQRGVTEPAASLTAETGIAVFKVAFDTWVAASDDRDFPRIIRDLVEALKAMATG